MSPPSSRFVLLDRRTLSISIALILTLAIAAPALADYLGPDRVTSVIKNVHVPEKDVWTVEHDPLVTDEKPYICLIIHPCSEHPSVERQLDICKWTKPADKSGCTEWWEEQEVTVTLPEATISAELQTCALVDGWCTSSPTLSLTGSEPVDGETIMLIEGTRNGEVFACEWASCNVPLLEGNNDFTFWAHSSWGDTSQMGTLSPKVDSQGPSIGIPDAWFIWVPLAIQVDDERGVALIELTVKGGEYGNRHYQWNLGNLPSDFIWDRYFGEVVAPIGDYPVTVEAWDGLGNGSTAHGTIFIPPPEEQDTEEAAALIEAVGEHETEQPAEDETSEAGEEPADSEMEVELSEPEPEASSSAETNDGDESDAIENGLIASASTSEDGETQTTVPPTIGGSGVLWGAAAAAAISAATAYGLNRKKQREAAIEAKRKEIAERRPEAAFARHLRSLREAAWARIEPTVVHLKAAALAAAAAAGAEAAREMLRELQTERLADRLGDGDFPQSEDWDLPAESTAVNAQQTDTQIAIKSIGEPDSLQIPGAQHPSLPDGLAELLPSFSFTPHSEKIPLLTFGIYELGVHNVWRVGTSSPAPTYATETGPGLNLGLVKIHVNSLDNVLTFTLRTAPRTEYLGPSGIAVERSYSVSTQFEWTGWNSLIRGNINVQDLRVKSPSELGYTGAGSQGLYYEQKPLQVLAVITVTGVIVVGSLLGGPPFTEAVGRWLQQLGGPLAIPGG